MTRQTGSPLCTGPPPPLSLVWTLTLRPQRRHQAGIGYHPTNNKQAKFNTVNPPASKPLLETEAEMGCTNSAVTPGPGHSTA